ncbi:RNA polymerase sigma factor SigJ [Nocardia asteroides]|uniref:RNA polymerase sigma factor SigJ n=1 Tax=Nocardia asteroides TaxID=1824 RepID=UPI001E63D761|nr:RNA polymerase sigma factor SigJ [Nocardia asteroides]UGT60857.1 RNA polymerase sigma factor SigJ [Nocardia asteroides]
MTDPFAEHRPLLFATAYRMLGSVADAEDILQDAWLKWHGTEQATVEHPKAYLVRTVTNLALNRLTGARATRERYVGPWLPEPLTDGDPVAAAGETADSVSTAMLVVLESLGPVERVVFVLREVFGYSHAEIAEFLERPEPTVRQLAHRAREHVRARRPRFETDTAVRSQVTERFLLACRGGDVGALMAVLAPDVTLWNDGGGLVTAARRPLHGPDHVARWLIGVLAKPILTGIEFGAAVVNGELSVIGRLGPLPVGVLTYDLRDGLIVNLRFQVNPEKLRGITPRTGEPSPPPSRP